MRKIVELGETLRLYLGYNDIVTGETIDPPQLQGRVLQPDGTEVSFLYPSANFVRESEGNYFIRVDTPMRGTYRYEVTASYASGDVDKRGGKFDAEPVM